MSLVAQLLSASEQAGRISVKKEANRARIERWKVVAEKGWEQHTKGAIERYAKVIFRDVWSTQAQIEQRLGYASTVSTPFLRKLEKMGYIQKRNRDGAEVYNRKRGYEYLWIKEIDNG